MRKKKEDLSGHHPADTKTQRVSSFAPAPWGCRELVFLRLQYLITHLSRPSTPLLTLKALVLPKVTIHMYIIYIKSLPSANPAAPPINLIRCLTLVSRFYAQASALMARKTEPVNLLLAHSLFICETQPPTPPRPPRWLGDTLVNLSIL